MRSSLLYKYDTAHGAMLDLSPIFANAKIQALIGVGTVRKFATYGQEA
jgi:hypothetical protein